MQTLIRATESPSKSFRPPFSKGGGSRAAPLVAAFLFCELTSKARKRAFFFAPVVAKEKSEIKQLPLTPPRRLLHRCRRLLSCGVFSYGGYAACYIVCECEFYSIVTFRCETKKYRARNLPLNLVPFKGMARRPSRWVPTALCEGRFPRSRRGEG